MVKILDLVPIMQSVAVLDDNIEFMQKKDKKSKDFVKQGAKNIVSATLISETSNFLK